MQPKLFSIEPFLAKIKKFNSKTDISLVKRAYEFALKTHGETESSARMQHLLSVADIISEMHVNAPALATAILHDTMLREGTERKEIEKAFGQEIAALTEECAKAFAIEEKNINRLPAEMLSTIILASAKDIRAVFIILASAWDTLNRQGIIEEIEKESFAKMCLSVLVPVSDKIGLSQMKWALEDSCLKILNPEAYEKIKRLVKEKREKREKEIEEIVFEIKNLLKKEKIKATVSGRAKHFFAINRKMQRGTLFEEMHDLRGARIICNNIKECYEILGAINSNYPVLAGEFDDYIVNPKENKYKSLHTVILWKKIPVEIQIRTWEMHWDNETGFAAHWAYKEYMPNKYFDKKLGWALTLVEWLQTKEKAKDFVEALKIEFGEGKIFVFTPKREVIVLPEKSTPVDFAFAVHSELGFKCVRAKVNGKIVPLDSELDNGDSVEIVTGIGVTAKRDWLGFVKLEKAKVKIRQKLGIKPVPIKKIKRKQALTTANSMVRLAKCCNPLPGEEITGLKTTKRKIIAHKTDCKNIKKIQAGKKVLLSWDIGTGEKFEIQIRVKARDSTNLLPGLLNSITSSGASLVATSAKLDKSNIVYAVFKIKVSQAKQASKIMGKIKKLPQVFEAERM